MEIHTPIRKIRSTQEIIRDAFQFIGNDLKALIPSVAIFSLTLIITGLVLSFYSAGKLPSVDLLIHSRDSLGGPFFVIFLIGVILSTLGICTLTLVLNRRLLLHDSGEPVSQGFQNTKRNFIHDIKTYLINFIIIYVIYYVSTFALSWFRKSDFLYEGPAEDDVLAFLISGLILSLPSLLLSPILFYYCFSSLFMSMRDNIGSSDALKKIHEISGKKLRKIWISSFVILLLSILIQWLFSAILQYFYMIVPMNPLIFYILAAVRYFFTLAVLCLMQVAYVFLLGSIEDEDAGYYIRKKIEAVDSTPNSPTISQ